MSAPADDRLGPGAVALILLALAFLLRAAILEPVIPDEDDCRAQRRAADCWKDRPIYDELGRRVQ